MEASDLWLTKILAAFLRPALNLKKGQPRGIVDHIIAIPEVLSLRLPIPFLPLNTTDNG